ncbi:MAG: hypothetical protein ACN6NX_01960 [Acinetobacter sp.]
MLKAAVPASLCLMLLSACSNPVPQNMRKYAGTWRNDDSSVVIEISPEGRLKYRLVEINNKKSIQGNIQSLDNSIIHIGYGPFSSKFKVTAEPHLNNNGIWSMTVDGRYLNRAQ